MTRIDWRLAAAVILVVAANTYLGFQAVGHSVYRSSAQVFEEFMNGPIRLLFPIIVTLVAGSQVARQLSSRWVASTRTRMDIRRRVASEFLTVTAGIFVVFFLVGLLNAFAAFIIVPATMPDAIDPGSYGLHSQAAVLADAGAHAPFATLLATSTALFVAASSAWVGLNGAVFAALTLVAVYLIPKPLVALLIPLAVYLFESVLFQLFGLPGASFLLSAVFPSGLQTYDLTEAIAPTAVLGLLCIGAAVMLIRTARSNPRLS